MSKETPFSNANTPQKMFFLPTGWLDRQNNKLVKEVMLREMTGKEEDLLATVNELNSDKVFNKIITNCIDSIGDVTDKQKIGNIILELLTNDRFFLLYKIREISLGKIYKFEAPCPHCKYKKDVHGVDLTEITFGSLKDPMKRVYSGNLPRSGMSYSWVVQDGKKEMESYEVYKKSRNKLLTAIIAQRLETLNDKPATMEDVEKLNLIDRKFLRNEIEKTEGDVDNNVDITCRNCGEDYQVLADVTRKEFFFPSEI